MIYYRYNVDTSNERFLAMNGSIRQSSWAEKIEAYFKALAKVAGVTLPEIDDAIFWIDRKDLDIDTIALEAQKWASDVNRISTPFSSIYPRYGNQDARDALIKLSNAVIIDTETTGLIKCMQSEIVEISIVCLDTSEILYDKLLKPFHYALYGDEKSAKAIRIHGIQKEELVDCPTIKDEWPTIKPILLEHQIVAYNDSFDMGMLMKSLRMWGLIMPKLCSTDAMRLFSAYINDWDRWHKLEDACKTMGVDSACYGKAHRSSNDALVTAALIQAMRDSI